VVAGQEVNAGVVINSRIALYQDLRIGEEQARSPGVHKQIPGIAWGGGRATGNLYAAIDDHVHLCDDHASLGQ
jgi:hypothetical protein